LHFVEYDKVGYQLRCTGQQGNLMWLFQHKALAYEGKMAFL